MDCTKEWPCWSMITSFIVPLLIVFVFSRVKYQQEVVPFRLLDLPPELRQLVYRNLIDQELPYPSTTKLSKSGRNFPWLLSTPKAYRSGLKNMLLANRQVYEELLGSMCMHARFVLDLDEHNYKNDNLWNINESTLSNLRSCDITITTTSKMLDAVDPRHMARTWSVRDRLCHKIRTMKKVKGISLHIRAIGDPLWNPVWVWYHASQSFKTSEAQQIHSISFSLDTWSPGENHLVRDQKDKWVWHCPAGHYVVSDPGIWQPIREFCVLLYADCHRCHPEDRGTE